MPTYLRPRPSHKTVAGTLRNVLVPLAGIFLVTGCSPYSAPQSSSPSAPSATSTTTAPPAAIPSPTTAPTGVPRLPPSGAPGVVDGVIALSTIGYHGDLYILRLTCLAQPEGCYPALMQLEDPGYLEWFPALSPDGVRLAFVSDRGQESGEGLYLIELDTLAVRRLTLEPGWFRDLAWSPDGRSLAFSHQSTDGGPETIAIIDTEGGGLLRFTQIREHMEGPSWSPDGHSIAFLGTDNWPAEPYSNLYVSDTKGTTIRELGPSQPAFYELARWSPQGTQILTSIWPQQDLILLDVQTSEVTYLTRSTTEEEAPYWSPDGQWLAYSVYDEGLWHIEVRNLPGDSVFTVAGPFDEAVGPIWSPDGSFLAFDAPAGEYRQAFIAAPDGSWIRQITNADLPLFVDSVWTP